MILDRSKDLYLTPHPQGVRLTGAPGASSTSQALTIAQSLAYTCNVYILNSQSEIQHINESSLESCGHDTALGLIGKSVANVLTDEDARISMGDDRAVLRSRQIKLYEHSMTVQHTHPMRCISAKAPLLDEADQIIGIFGCTVVLGQQSLPDSLALMTRLGLIRTTYQQTKTSADNPFTTRERQILQHLVCGMSAKIIADRLIISRRTVEHHIENMKAKLNCPTKYDLINRCAKYLHDK